MIRLEGWSIVDRMHLTAAPEREHKHLMGRIYGSPDHMDGMTIVTGQVTEIEGDVVRSLYGPTVTLGEIDVYYYKKYPHAREELLRAHGLQSQGA
jgi:hypothetical protein